MTTLTIGKLYKSGILRRIWIDLGRGFEGDAFPSLYTVWADWSNYGYPFGELEAKKKTVSFKFATFLVFTIYLQSFLFMCWSFRFQESLILASQWWYWRDVALSCGMISSSSQLSALLRNRLIRLFHIFKTILRRGNFICDRWRYMEHNISMKCAIDSFVSFPRQQFFCTKSEC